MSNVPHVVIVSLEDPDDPDSEIIHDVLHPTDCPWSIEWRATASRNLGDVTVDRSYEYQRSYNCALAWEMENNGCTDLPQEPGAYWVGTWIHRSPSGPWGPAEYDGGVHWEPIVPPQFTAQPINAPTFVGNQRDGFSD